MHVAAGESFVNFVGPGSFDSARHLKLVVQYTCGRARRLDAVQYFIHAHKVSFTLSTVVPGRIVRVSGVRLTSRTSLPSTRIV